MKRRSFLAALAALPFVSKLLESQPVSMPNEALRAFRAPRPNLDRLQATINRVIEPTFKCTLELRRADDSGLIHGTVSKMGSRLERRFTAAPARSLPAGYLTPEAQLVRQIKYQTMYAVRELTDWNVMPEGVS